ncbi:hypothetical protein GCM10022416_29440 [Actinomadura keratinilytica]|uniref:Membrane protein insertion efficiency factor YidD n=1 Tax=Actinomadura keratinilytica TaxID=547461 RepID=A0ABP7YU91_9ACTN
MRIPRRADNTALTGMPPHEYLVAGSPTACSQPRRRGQPRPYPVDLGIRLRPIFSAGGGSLLVRRLLRCRGFGAVGAEPPAEQRLPRREGRAAPATAPLGTPHTDRPGATQTTIGHMPPVGIESPTLVRAVTAVSTCPRSTEAVNRPGSSRDSTAEGIPRT